MEGVITASLELHGLCAGYPHGGNVTLGVFHWRQAKLPEINFLEQPPSSFLVLKSVQDIEDNTCGRIC